MHYDDRLLLHAPDALPFESGVERLDDGVFHVAALTRMPDVRAEMVGWWFGTYMQTTEHYRRWHPRDHVWMDWANKKPGTHVGASHLVHEYIGGQLQKLAITFVDPVENMGAEANAPGRLFVCARVSPLGRHDVTIAGWSTPPTTPTGAASCAVISGWGWSRPTLWVDGRNVSPIPASSGDAPSPAPRRRRSKPIASRR